MTTKTFKPYDIKLNENYGDLKKYISYSCVGNGLDHLIVKYHGARIFVPDGLIVGEGDWVPEDKPKRQDDEEDFEDGDWGYEQNRKFR